jgi:aryl carrier-like protein
VEEVLVSIWEHVLQVPRVGIQDNFFELGGDSIRSVAIIALARQRSLKLSLQDLFRHPTISALAAVGREETELLPAVTSAFGLLSEQDRSHLPEGLEDAYPLTQLQAGMLYHMQLTRGRVSPDYHNVDSHCLHLSAPFVPLALQAAVDQVVSRHAVLRTSFEFAHYSEPMQLVHRQARLVG